MSALDWLALAVCGGLGAFARFAVDSRIERGRFGEFPLGTLAVNVMGSAGLGVLTGAGVTKATIFVLGTGLIGAFTTFSTWMFETQRLLEDGEGAVAAANVVIAVGAGLAAAAAGWAIGAAA